MNYIDKLINNCNKAKSTTPVKEFTLNNLSDLDNIKKAIYIIEEVGGNTNETHKLLEKYKKLKKRSCPKINKPSSIMYIGSSTTSIKTRIKQHLGDGNKNTYALHLKHWFKGNFKITIKEYDASVSREVLQIIEDDLSDKLKPAFGKLGANNK